MNRTLDVLQSWAVPRFVDCLVDLVVSKSAGASLGLPTCRNLFQKDPSRRPPKLCPYWLTERR